MVGKMNARCTILILLHMCLWDRGTCQSCDIPDEFQNDGDNLRWFHRYDEGSILWLFKYKHDTFSQVTDTGSSEVVYICTGSFNDGDEFFMVRFNTIIPTKYWCEKLRMSSNGQSLIRLQAVIPSGENPTARQCSAYIDDQYTRYPPQFIPKHTVSGFAEDANACGFHVPAGTYRALYSVTQDVYHCNKDVNSNASISQGSIDVNTCYKGSKDYPLVESELKCVASFPGDVVDNNENGHFLLFKKDFDRTSLFYCARYFENTTCKFMEISMYTQNPKKGVCASGGTYSTVGSGSVVLKLWHPDDPCGLFTDDTVTEASTMTTKIEVPSTTVKLVVTDILHVKMVYKYEGPVGPDQDDALSLIEAIYDLAEDDKPDTIQNVDFEPGLEGYASLRLDLKDSKVLVEETEDFLRQFWTKIDIMKWKPVKKSNTFKVWKGDEELCPSQACHNDTPCVYNPLDSIQSWYCLCPEKFSSDPYCKVPTDESSPSEALPKKTLIIILVVGLAVLVVLAVVLSLVLCRRRKQDEPLYNTPRDAYDEDSTVAAAKGTITAFHSKSFATDVALPDLVKPEF